MRGKRKAIKPRRLEDHEGKNASHLRINKCVLLKLKIHCFALEWYIARKEQINDFFKHNQQAIPMEGCCYAICSE